MSSPPITSGVRHARQGRCQHKRMLPRSSASMTWRSGEAAARSRAVGRRIPVRRGRRGADGHLRSLGLVKGDILTWEPQERALRRNRRLAAAELRALLPASALVELGVGLRGMLFPVAQLVRRECAPLFIALEFTRSGRELLARIAEAEAVSVTVGACDLGAANVTAVRIPTGAVLLHLLRGALRTGALATPIDSLCAVRPKAVVQASNRSFIPSSADTTLGILRRRYLQANDYNQNLPRCCGMPSETVGSLSVRWSPTGSGSIRYFPPRASSGHPYREWLVSSSSKPPSRCAGSPAALNSFAPEL